MAKQTNEEKAVGIIAKLLASLELDIEMVGRYLANNVSRVVYNRFIVIAESAEYEREQQQKRIEDYGNYF
jgi:hypothetical protein